MHSQAIILGSLISVAYAVTTRSPVSHVKGLAFNRYVNIYLENTDYSKAIGDPNLAWIAQQGILLTNYFSVTHPSEPNYVASVGGEYFGIDNDNDNTIPANVSSVVDILEDKGIAWGEYMEYMPSTGYTGSSYVDQSTGVNRYVRKHNPLAMYASVINNSTRAGCLKSLNQFYTDLNNNQLPQWMFITPDMQHDGHDTSVTTAGSWTRSFLTPLLTNANFMNKTLVLITFDESHTYSAQNRVYAVLLGDAVPANLVGTTDANFYDHYSQLSTVESNWNLHTLGRYDVGANVFSWVASIAGEVVRTLDITKVILNASYPGIFNSAKWAAQPVPDTSANYAGRTVLSKIISTWGSLQSKSVYKNAPLNVPSAANPPVYP